MTTERSDRSVSVGIGMPAFNGERFIEEAIDSILGQSYEDFELVISDNASTDRTEKICRAYAAKDERVVYVRNRVNYGAIFNFNNVFRLSSGRYFHWQAADDVIGRDFLLRCTEVLNHDHSSVIAYTTTVGIDEHGARVEVPNLLSDANSPQSTYSLDPVTRFRRLMRNPYWVAGAFFGLIRSEVLTRTLLNGNFHGADHALLAELALHGQFHEIREELFFSRYHSDDARANNQTLLKRIAWYEPQEQRGLRLWRLVRGHPRRIWGYLSVILRSPVGRRQKARCAWEVARSIVWWFKVRGIPNARRALTSSKGKKTG